MIFGMINFKKGSMLMVKIVIDVISDIMINLMFIICLYFMFKLIEKFFFILVIVNLFV